MIWFSKLNVSKFNLENLPKEENQYVKFLLLKIIIRKFKTIF